MKRLNNKNILNDKKGSLIDIIIFIIFAFVIVVFFGMYLYGHALVTDTLEGITTPVGNTNLSEIAKDTFGQVDEGLQTLKILSFALIFGMILTMLLSNFLIKVHPAFFFAYVGINILAVILAVTLSNQYELLLSNDVFGSTLMGFTASNYVLLYLPVWATVIGFLGAIILMIGIIRDREFGSPI